MASNYDVVTPLNKFLYINDNFVYKAVIMMYWLNFIFFHIFYEDLIFFCREGKGILLQIQINYGTKMSFPIKFSTCVSIYCRLYVTLLKFESLLTTKNTVTSLETTTTQRQVLKRFRTTKTKRQVLKLQRHKDKS